MFLFAAVFLFLMFVEAQVEFVTEECVDDAQLTIFTQPLNFEAAVTFCDQEGGTLARIGSEGEHFRVLDLVFSSSLDITEFWIGKTKKPSLLAEMILILH